MSNPTPAKSIFDVVSRYRDIVDDWDAFYRSLQQPLPMCVWANSLRSNGQEIQQLLDGADMAPEPLTWRDDAFRVKPSGSLSEQWWYLIGLAHAQEEVSQVPVALLDVKPGMRVLDMCAAPGGKTAQIAMVMENRGTVIANDISTGRLRALAGNLERLGLVNVATTRCDGITYPTAAGQFDRILLDAPCSGEGTLRKNPTHTEHMGVEASQTISETQKLLLRKAVQRCKPGGHIVYSTCTFAPEENEMVVDAILEAFPGVITLMPAKIEGLVSSPGLTSWQGCELDQSLAGAMRLWPHQNDSGGFFVAVLKKSEESENESWQPARLNTREGDEGFLQGLSKEFGLDESVWQRYQIHRQNNKGMNLTSVDHQPPLSPKAEGTGTFFYRTNSRPPKLSTSAAMVLGEHATRHRFELDEGQLSAYINRQPVVPTKVQLAGITPGYVIVYYRGHALGMGVFHKRSQTLESQFPSRWCGRAMISN